MKVTLPYQVVLLVRGEGSKVPLIVLPHEVEVLKNMHGEDHIQLTDAEPPIKESVFETADEYSRLEQYYRGNVDNPNPTRAVWRTLDEFENSFSADKTDKAALLEEAVSLGIPAKATWGAAKLQQAITEALDA